VPEPADYYQIAGRRIPLRRVTTAAVLQPRARVARATIGRALARTESVIAEPTAGRHVLVRGPEEDVADLEDLNSVEAARAVYLDPQGVELALTDEVAIGFRPGTAPARRLQVCRKHDVVPVKKGGSHWVVRTDDPSPDAALRVANAVAAEPEVRFAEPNALQLPRYEAVPPPANDLFVRQWHLWGTPGSDIRVLDAWEVTRGQGVRVVVHDTGVDPTHPNLQPNLLPGRNYDDDNDDTAPLAFLANAAHGTACAGLVGAARNGRGVVGVAPECRLVPLRVQRRIAWDRMAATFRWAADKGEVLLCSWVIPESTLVAEAICRAAARGRGGRGTVCVFASGNDAADTVSFPANLSRASPVLAVGGSTNQAKRAGYSNGGDGLDVLAPSSGGTLGMETTDIMGPQGYNRLPDGDYCKADDASNFQGTSAAAAVAAGVAALVLAANPELPAAAVKDLLRATADKIDPETAQYGGTGWSRTHGYGRINADRAVRSAKARGGDTA
jgi:subtilisin family serine protease